MKNQPTIDHSRKLIELVVDRIKQAEEELADNEDYPLPWADDEPIDMDYNYLAAQYIKEHIDPHGLDGYCLNRLGAWLKATVRADAP